MLLDSHAEVLARRAALRSECSEQQRLRNYFPLIIIHETRGPSFDYASFILRFLWSHVEHVLAGKPSTVLERASEGSIMRVKEGVRFHLYISQSPCGDASIFPSNPLQGTHFITLFIHYRLCIPI